MGSPLSESVFKASMRRTTREVIDAYNSWDVEKIMAFRAPDCKQQILPRSLGRPERNNEEYRAQMSLIQPLYRNFRVTPHTITYNLNEKRVVIHATSTAETDAGPYANEYMLTLWLTEDAMQVARLEEFVDSAASARQAAALEKNIGLNAGGLWGGKGSRSKL